MRHSHLVPLFVAAFPFLQATAQIEQEGTPLSLERAALPPVTYVTMHPVDVPALLAQDAINAQDKSIPYRFGWNHTVDLGPSTCGTWTDMPDGARIWRLGIECPGAISINMVFTEFDVPEGAKLFILNEAGERIGAFTRKNDHGEHVLGVRPVRGERAIVEYDVPAHTPTGKLRIGQVTHGYRDLDRIARALGESGSCNNNVICPEGDPWRDQIRSVAMIVVGGSGICTGTLINNCANDGTPYFLTANHCLPNNLNVSTWVFRFGWESPTCTPTANGPTNRTISGATVLASGAGSDFGLLRLNSTPPANYNVYYSGWDKSGTVPTNTTCIHHPQGDIKKISFDNNAPTSVTYGGAQVWKIAAWDDGTTEPGSSGSGLWDQNKRLIGQLYGGDATCSNNVNDNFGRLAVSFPSLQQWLGGCGNTLNGYDPNAPTVALDAQATDITDIAGTCAATRTPKVTIRNGGTTTLTSVTVGWSLNGGAVTTQVASLDLTAGSTTMVTLPTMNMNVGANTLTVTLSAPNGGTDLNATNDQVSATVLRGTNSMTFNLTLDRYGSETTWKVGQGSTVYASGGPYTDAATNGAYPQAAVTFCLPDGCFDLTVSDSYGDGICCNFGNGGYTLVGPGGTLVTGNGQFTTSTTTNFCYTGSIKVAAKVFLDGAFDSASGLMRDDLRAASRIPTTEPYTALGYTHTGGGGGETVQPSVLAVTGANAIVDWVVLELRQSGSPATIVASRSALVQRDGDIVAVDGTSPVSFTSAPGAYHIAVRHRNHLGCMTNATVALSGTAASVDLTIAGTTTYGTEARKTVGTVRTLWSGNVVWDATLKYLGTGNDRDPILGRVGGSVPTATTTGYYVEDVNLDGTVKYIGAGNDRDPILGNVGGSVPTAVRAQQLP